MYSIHPTRYQLCWATQDLERQDIKVNVLQGVQDMDVQEILWKERERTGRSYSEISC